MEKRHHEGLEYLGSIKVVLLTISVQCNVGKYSTGISDLDGAKRPSMSSSVKHVLDPMLNHSPLFRHCPADNPLFLAPEPQILYACCEIVLVQDLDTIAPGRSSLRGHSCPEKKNKVPQRPVLTDKPLS